MVVALSGLGFTLGREARPFRFGRRATPVVRLVAGAASIGALAGARSQTALAVLALASGRTSEL